MQLFLAVFVLWLLVGCTGPARAPTDSLFSEQDAIDWALQYASKPQPEIDVTGVSPTKARAERMTFAEAMRRVHNNDDVPAGYSPTMPVWVVTMDGLWRDAFPRPTGMPTPEPFRHYTVIIDARNGRALGSAARH